LGGERARWEFTSGQGGNVLDGTALRIEPQRRTVRSINRKGKFIGGEKNWSVLRIGWPKDSYAGREGKKTGANAERGRKKEGGKTLATPFRSGKRVGKEELNLGLERKSGEVVKRMF